jgi:hypothetical protein
MSPSFYSIRPAGLFAQPEICGEAGRLGAATFVRFRVMDMLPGRSAGHFPTFDEPVRLPAITDFPVHRSSRDHRFDRLISSRPGPRCSSFDRDGLAIPETVDNRKQAMVSLSSSTESQ